jgi:Protein of unknown function (DUF3619)
MNADDQEFAKKITAYLDAGTAELKAGTAYRLQLARTKALARLDDPQHAVEPQLALAGAGTGTIGGIGGRSIWASGRLWIGVALIAFASVGYQQWQAYQQLSDLADTDAAILSSDLPIDAYLDRGFLNWLKTSGDD